MLLLLLFVRARHFSLQQHEPLLWSINTFSSSNYAASCLRCIANIAMYMYVCARVLTILPGNINDKSTLNVTNNNEFTANFLWVPIKSAQISTHSSTNFFYVAHWITLKRAHISIGFIQDSVFIIFFFLYTNKMLGHAFNYIFL